MPKWHSVKNALHQLQSVKCLCVKMPICQNAHLLKCQNDSLSNVFVSKCLSVKMPICQNAILLILFFFFPGPPGSWFGGLEIQNLPDFQGQCHQRGWFGWIHGVVVKCIDKQKMRRKTRRKFYSQMSQILQGKKEMLDTMMQSQVQCFLSGKIQNINCRIFVRVPWF